MHLVAESKGSAQVNVASNLSAQTNPLKFNSQAAWVTVKTKGTITLKYYAVHKRFTPHSYWKVIRWAKWLSFSNSTLPTERDSPRSRVFLPPYFKAEAMGKESRPLQVLSRKKPRPLRRLDLPDCHFQQFCIQFIRIQQSGPADVDSSTPARPNRPRKRCHYRTLYAKKYVTRVRVPKRTNCWGHAHPVTSTPALQQLKY